MTRWIGLLRDPPRMLDVRKKKELIEQLVFGDPFCFPGHRTFEIFSWGKLLEDQTALL